MHNESKEILDRNTAWIENCDSKTSIFFWGGSFGLIAGILLAIDYISKFKSILYHFFINVDFINAHIQRTSLVGTQIVLKIY